MFLFSLLPASAPTVALKTVLPIHFSRPSRLLDRMEMSVPYQKAGSGNSIMLRAKPGRGLIPDGLTVTADDLNGNLILRGSDQAMDEMKGLVSQFDVAPRAVELYLTIDSKIDKLTYSVSAELRNNHEWDMGDPDTGVKLRVTPRINIDGTVTCAIEYRRDRERGSTFVFRVNNLQQKDLSDPIKKPGLRRTLPDPKISMRFRISDDQPAETRR